MSFDVSSTILEQYLSLIVLTYDYSGKSHGMLQLYEINNIISYCRLAKS